MRDLGKSDRNELTIHDRLSGSEIVLYYRMPSTSEMAVYQSKLIRRRGKKVLINAFDTRLDSGLMVLTGFREGDFGMDGKPISSEQGSEHYRADWKDLLRQNAADIVTAFAFTVFEGASVGTGEDIEFEEPDEASPLPESSGIS